MWRFLSHRELHIPFVTFWIVVFGVVVSAIFDEELIMYAFAVSGIVMGTLIYQSIRREQRRERKAMR